jgi:FtsP/CotA-like multicopper oxidase with cupredoxin domain
MNGITRRQFLVGSAAAGAALTLPLVAPGARAMGGGGVGGGGMGGGVTVIDPPVGAALRQPPLAQNISTDPAVVEVSIEAMQAPIDVNGRVANLLTYNGRFPGPMVRARNDQLLRLRFKNSLPDDGQVNFLGHSTRMTNIHTHGLHVTPGVVHDDADPTKVVYGDYMLAMADPGQSLLYEYDLSIHRPNLNFYHPHIHGSVTDQMWGGMSAPLIVEDTVAALAPFAEKVLVLKDITLAGDYPEAHNSNMDYMMGVEGTTVMVNGQVNPRLAIAPGQVQRWRVVNACTARFFRLNLQSHTMSLVGTDGGLLDKPYPISEILLAPGERVDLLIKGTAKSGSFKWLSLPYDRGSMGGLQQVTLMTLTYGGARQNQSIPAVVDPSAVRLTDLSMVAQRKQMTLTMDMGMGAMGGGGMGGSGGGMGGGGGMGMRSVGIDGMTYHSHEDCYMTHSEVGTWEIWEVINGSLMDHPFHHHTNNAQVLSITGGNAGYAGLYTSIPAWKDVTIVPAGGRIQLLMPVMDYAGMAMIHCHIIEHEDIGMMGIWHIIGDGPMPGM